TTEGEIAANLRNPDPAEKFPGRIPYRDTAVAECPAGIARHPHVPFDVAAQSIRTALDAIDHAIGEQPPVRGLVIGANIERIDLAFAACTGVARSLPGARDVDLLEVRREGDAIRIRHLI